MRYTFFSLLLFTCFTTLNSCKKDSPALNDCQAKNYGIFKVNYGSNTERHRVTVFMGFGYIEKISDIGVTSDTLHVQTGTHLTSVASINAIGANIDNKDTTLNYIQCGETPVSVSF